MFDLAALAETDARIKAWIDQYIGDGNCTCDTETMVFINKLLIIRKGVSLGLQVADTTGAEFKMQLLNDMMDQGVDYNCGC